MLAIINVLVERLMTLRKHCLYYEFKRVLAIRVLPHHSIVTYIYDKHMWRVSFLTLCSITGNSYMKECNVYEGSLGVNICNVYCSFPLPDHSEYISHFRSRYWSLTCAKQVK